MTEIMKNKVVWLLTFLCILISGCKAATFSTHEKYLQFMGNPTTGYTWIFTVGNESIIEVEESVKYMGEENMVGAPSLFMYKISSVKPGKTTLKFEYKRPWEKKAAEESRFYEVSVKASGKLVLKETKEELKMNSFKSVSMNEGLKMMAKDKNFVLLDVRRPEEYAEGHVPGAVQLTNETFAEEDAAKVISAKAQTVYVMCRSGRRSKESSQKLIDFGYTNVIEIGGILDYAGPIEK